ncbi:MAG: mycofactocin biosynthesis peptidyl-dipeptidase MftE [Pseudonocardia sp.]|nr:mycofactocin biosynthesis peptidyl-dipeptidase MftE [Pseudonocardia sp.]
MGSIEQHGPHLPLDTDTRVAVAVCRRAFAGMTGVDLAPPLAYGASGEHEGFAGTLSIGHAALRAVLIELGRSASRWADRLLFVNGHGGNLPTIVEAVATLRQEGRDTAWFGCGVAGGDAHAGHTETSILLALNESLVRRDVAVAGNTASLTELMPVLTAGGVAAASPNGVLGDPAGATAAAGKRALADMERRLRTKMIRWRPDAHGHLT